MKNLLVVVCIWFAAKGFAQSETYLYDIPKYQEESEFDDSLYSNLTWQKFYQLAAPNEIIDPYNYDFDLMNAACFFAVNKYRFSKNLPVLKYNNLLRDAAVIHTDQMVKHNFFDHFNRYDAKINAPNLRTELCGYVGEKIAENLVRSFMSLEKPLSYIQLAEKITNELKKSPEHNQHMLDKEYNQLGCGFLFEARPKDGYIFLRMTQEFGKSW